MELPPQSKSFAKEDVKGALRPEGFMEPFPVGYKFSTPTPAPLPSSTSEEKVEVEMEVKEIKMEVREEEATIATDVEMKNDDNNENSSDPNGIVCEGVVAFRDGEHHSGEAHMDDIVDGYNDGELSDRCELYISELDEWIIIEEVLKRRRRPKNVPESMEVDNPKPKPEVTPKSVPAVVKKMEGKSASREKKKPSRDSSAWGKASTTASSLSLSLPL